MIIRRAIGEKGQVVIPRDIREHLGLGVGIAITFEVDGENIILKKEGNPEDVVNDFFNTPKIKKRIDVKKLKKVFEERYEK